MYTYAISLRVNILNKIVIKHQLSYMIDLNVCITEKSIASHIKKGLAWNIIISVSIGKLCWPFGLALYISQS